jgi:mono/diheme cytochrome c family protein
MKTKLSTILTISAIGTFTFLLLAFTSPNIQDDGWVVPDKYKTMKNAFPGKDADGIGEDLYKQHCRSCHGSKGLGDGTKSKELKTEMRDFTSKEVQAQTDGELYYKAIIGHDEMPNFEKKIKEEEDRWMLVNYIRALAK